MGTIVKSKIKFYSDEHEREEPGRISTDEEGEQNDVSNEWVRFVKFM